MGSGRRVFNDEDVNLIPPEAPAICKKNSISIAAGVSRPTKSCLRFRKHVKTPSPLWVWPFCKNSLSLGPQRDAPRPDVHIGVLQDGRSGGVRETFLEHEKLHDLVSNAPNFDLEEGATPELEVHRPRQLDFRSLCTAQ